MRSGNPGPLQSPPGENTSSSQKTLPAQQDATGAHLFTQRGLFDPNWRTGVLTAADGDTSLTDPILLRPALSASTDMYLKLGNEAPIRPANMGAINLTPTAAQKEETRTTKTLPQSAQPAMNRVTPVNQTRPLQQAIETGNSAGNAPLSTVRSFVSRSISTCTSSPSDITPASFCMVLFMSRKCGPFFLGKRDERNSKPTVHWPPPRSQKVR